MSYNINAKQVSFCAHISYKDCYEASVHEPVASSIDDKQVKLLQGDRKAYERTKSRH